jgi:hypothetical protein
MAEQHGIRKDGNFSIIVDCKCEKCEQARNALGNAIDRKISRMIDEGKL